MEPLVNPNDLSEFPGAPYAVWVLNAAAESIRDECGWHIAPVRTETLTLDSDGGRILLLPTLRLVAVTEVRDVTTETPTVLTNWRKSAAGMLSRPGGWPNGLGAVEVDVVHGYDECPSSLYPVIADRCVQASRDGTITQESIGARQVSFGVTPGQGTLVATLARYKIPPTP